MHYLVGIISCFSCSVTKYVDKIFQIRWLFLIDMMSIACSFHFNTDLHLNTINAVNIKSSHKMHVCAW